MPKIFKKNQKNKGFLIFYEWNIDIIGEFFIIVKLNTQDLHYYIVIILNSTSTWSLLNLILCEIVNYIENIGF